MGMFDRYEPRPGLCCPTCGLSLSEWEGKSGPCWLYQWVQGRAAPANRSDDDDSASLRLPDDFEIYCWCESCSNWIDALGSCEGGVWTRVDLICPLEQADLPDDWLPLRGNEASFALEELRRELPKGHVLSARKLFPLARHREEEEDILVRTLGTDTLLWRVHLTLRSEIDPQLPRARPFRDLAEFAAQRDLE